MSAIGLLSGGSAPKKSRVIGAHADFRPEDFRFARTQSRRLSESRWESRIKPMHSWGEIALYATGGVVLTVAVVTMVT
jgi:hypothetical protein